MSNEKLVERATKWLTDERKLKITPKVLEGTFTELMADFAATIVREREAELVTELNRAIAMTPLTPTKRRVQSVIDRLESGKEQG